MQYWCLIVYQWSWKLEMFGGEIGRGRNIRGTKCLRSKTSRTQNLEAMICSALLNILCKYFGYVQKRKLNGLKRMLFLCKPQMYVSYIGNQTFIFVIKKLLVKTFVLVFSFSSCCSLLIQMLQIFSSVNWCIKSAFSSHCKNFQKHYFFLLIKAFKLDSDNL